MGTGHATSLNTSRPCLGPSAGVGQLSDSEILEFVKLVPEVIQ